MKPAAEPRRVRNHLFANYRHHGVRRRRPEALPAGPHVQEGRNKNSRQGTPEKVRGSRQRSVLTPCVLSGGWDLKAWRRAVANEELDIQIPDTDDSLNKFVGDLNSSLDKLDLEIVPFVDGLTGNQVYILVRSRRHHVSFSCQGANLFTP